MNSNERSAVITGGTKGIGYAIAKALLKIGYSTYICGRDRDDIETAIGRLSEFGTVFGKVCDVRDEKQVKNLIASAESRFGRIDVLVNNAGVGFNSQTVEEISGDTFRQTIETNLLGVFYACHYSIPIMKRHNGGYIINISSLAGQNPHPKMAAYNASKFAINGFSEALMQEVRQDGIKVSYVCPGSVNTEFGGDNISDANSWQLQPDDISQVVIGLLEMDPRALPSKVEIRPSRPPSR